MDTAIRSQLKPGVNVRVIQQIAGRDYSLNNEIRGTVMEYGQQQTGSWFAHSKCDKLWLDRLTIKKGRRRDHHAQSRRQQCRRNHRRRAG